MHLYQIKFWQSVCRPGCDDRGVWILWLYLPGVVCCSQPDGERKSKCSSSAMIQAPPGCLKARLGRKAGPFGDDIVI